MIQYIQNYMKEIKVKLFTSDKTISFRKTFEKLINKSNSSELEKIRKTIEYNIIKQYDPKKKKEPKEVKGYPILKYFLFLNF